MPNPHPTPRSTALGRLLVAVAVALAVITGARLHGVHRTADDCRALEQLNPISGARTDATCAAEVLEP